VAATNALTISIIHPSHSTSTLEKTHSANPQKRLQLSAHYQRRHQNNCIINSANCRQLEPAFNRRRLDSLTRLFFGLVSRSNRPPIVAKRERARICMYLDKSERWRREGWFVCVLRRRLTPNKFRCEGGRTMIGNRMPIVRRLITQLMDRVRADLHTVYDLNWLLIWTRQNDRSNTLFRLIQLLLLRLS
jgi:hypothetical protein